VEQGVQTEESVDPESTTQEKVELDGTERPPPRTTNGTAVDLSTIPTETPRELLDESSDSILAELIRDVDLPMENYPAENIQRQQVVFRQCVEVSTRAKPLSPFPASRKDLSELTERVFRQSASALIPNKEYEERPEPQKSDLLQGTFEKDVLSHQANLWVVELLRQYAPVFGELPAPGTCPKAVTMDLQLRPEWEGIPLRGKCFPMSRDDCEEIQRQVDELVEAGLVEEYQGQEFPKYCSPTFLVEKDKGKATKISTTQGTGTHGIRDPKRKTVSLENHAVWTDQRRGNFPRVDDESHLPNELKAQS